MLLRFIRVWLPAIVVLGGVAAIAIRRDADGLDGGAGIIGAGLSIWLLNLLHRIGVSGDHERTDEDDARRFFDEHGHWPDEPPRPADRVEHRTAPRPVGSGPHDRPRLADAAAARRRRRRR